MKFALFSLSGFLLMFTIVFSNAAVAAPAAPSCRDTFKTHKIPRAKDLYLEKVHGPRAMEWVKAENIRSLGRLQSDPRFQSLYDRLLQVFNSPDQLPDINLEHGYLFNHWQDATNPKGIFRKTSLESYEAGRPEWKTILDVDELSRLEKTNWVLTSVNAFHGKALVELSVGGKDATVFREFDIATGAFVKDGFVLPEGKNRADWLDEDTLLVSSAVHPNELTAAGYPRIVRKWRRGTKLAEALVVYAGDKTSTSAGAYITRETEDGDLSEIVVYQWDSSFEGKLFVVRDGRLSKVPIPADADFNTVHGWAYVSLKSKWRRAGKTYVSGDLIRIPLNDLLAGQGEPEVLFRSKRSAIYTKHIVMADRVFVSVSENVTVKWVELKKDARGVWQHEPLPLPQKSNVEIVSYSPDSGIAIFSSTGFLQPTTRYLFDAKTGTVKVLDKAVDNFDASPFEVKQHFARSKDGTRVPYFLVAAKNLTLDGNNPTILNAYGGFEISLYPEYSSSSGIGWLANGGVAVVANIRGGGEFGPAWHRAAMKENRQRAYDDFHAVAEDLIARKVTSPQKLGITGGSNGGLLMGVAITQRPDLYKAAVIDVPLLDMLRYHKLLAGASWIGEYGDPRDPPMRAIIAKYSPYHNVLDSRRYPEPFFMTSTADDRVHPGHARRMAALMQRQQHPYLFFENIMGGHGGAADNAQYANARALAYIYFMQKLMDPTP